MGVLHHTGNAYQGFHNILNLLAPEGKIVIGLYNTYGRIPLNVRQFLAKTVFKKNEKIKKWFIQMQIEDLSDKEKLRGWWNDQYLHPHETTHTAGEVIRWFKKNNIKYIQSFPSLELFDQSDPEISGIWNPEKYKSHPHLFARFVRQLQWFYQTHHEGGYWLTFGKKGAKTNP